MSGDSSRKPSGSSSHSGTHSPPSGSGNPSRKPPASPASNLYGMGGGNGGNGLKALNSGWQVWSSATPSPKRNASVGGGDMQPNVGESWSAPRSASGAWDDTAVKDYSREPQSHLNLPQARHRQSPASSLPAPRAADRTSGPRNPHVNFGKESHPPRYSGPAKSFATSSYTGPHPSFPLPGLDYDSGAAENEISQAMRGMVVEDDLSVLNARQPPMPVPVQGSNTQMRTSPQQRNTYGTYPSTDYGFYPPGRDSFADYPYVGYGNPDPSLYSSTGVPLSPVLYPSVPQNIHNTAMDIRQQPPGVYFDYNSPTRPSSQFFFPAAQTMPMYPPPHSPMLSSQLPATTAPVTLMEKRYNLQQQLASNLMFRASAPQNYATTLDYGSQMLNAAMHPSFGQPMRGIRRPGLQPEVPLHRSPLLDEYRAIRGRSTWELRGIRGHVVEFSGDQHGSRFIQEKLDHATSEERQIVFDEIVPNNTLQLIQDVFGNYVIQKLFEHGTQAQKTILLQSMSGHIVYLSSNLYGCRVVQKAIECVLPDQQAGIVRELEPHIMRCVKDSNGNHVIQKVIEHVSPDRLGFVSTFTGHVFELASHTFGCRVLQRCLQHLPPAQTRPLLDELLNSYTVDLMQDHFGNYVIQFILENGLPEDRAAVAGQLRGRMLNMARHKFASNVCEKALIHADSETRRLLIEEIMGPVKADGTSSITALMKDQFGNYVLQRALGVAEGEQKEALINAIRPQLVSLRKQSTAHSKHLTSIERELEKLSPTEPT